MFHKITPILGVCDQQELWLVLFSLCKPSNFGLVLRLPQAKKSSSKSKKANDAKDFRNKGPLRFCLRLTQTLSYRQVWANPQAVVYEHLSLSRAQMYRAPIMKEIIPRDGKMSSQTACILLNRTSICGRREGKCCAFGMNHSLQELEIKLKERLSFLKGFFTILLNLTMHS